ncbi:MAG: OmpA family protein [bacterium]
MKRFIAVLALSVIFSFGSKAQEDAPGCKDNPMFNRMPNYVIGDCSSNYDEVDIAMGIEKSEKKEGTKTFTQYNYALEEATAPSFLQIVRNFENAIAKTGGKRIYFSKEAGVATLFTKSGGKDVWVILNDGAGAKTGNFELTTLEIEGMKQDITANDMLNELNKSGFIALYINFETGKSIIKPESQKIVDQIAEMLKGNSSLKVGIEGHTDNVGTPASNKTLSESRAKSIMNAVTDKGIDKSRLSAKGWGAEKPIGDNKTEEGRAKNRRVEIVKK